MFLVILEWKTPWSVEQQVLEANTLDAARALATRYKRPGIRIRILEVSREHSPEAPAGSAEPTASTEMPSTEPAALAQPSKANS